MENSENDGDMLAPIVSKYENQKFHSYPIEHYDMMTYERVKIRNKLDVGSQLHAPAD
jgi:hypothetical protein